MAPPRFSLKWLLALVAMVAVTAAALASSSHAWFAAVCTGLSALLLVALLVAVFGAGRKRFFAGGFFVGALFYLLLWNTATSTHWLEVQQFDLLTVRLVDRLYKLVVRQVPRTTPTGTLPDGRIINFPVAITDVPDFGRFRKIAHWLIAWYVGIGSGLLALRLRPNAAAS